MRDRFEIGVWKPESGKEGGRRAGWGRNKAGAEKIFSCGRCLFFVQPTPPAGYRRGVIPNTYERETPCQRCGTTTRYAGSRGCVACAKRRYRHLRDRLTKYGRDYYRERRTTAERLFHAAKHRARRRGLPFELSLVDIVVPEVCPVLGLRLAVSDAEKRGASDHSPSLDRVDNRLGYVPGNVIVVSWRANNLKSDATPAELRAVADFYSALAAQNLSSPHPTAATMNP